MKNKWSLTWPKEPGEYWFCGYPWPNNRNKITIEDRIALTLVRVRAIQNGFIYIADGNIIYEREAFGWFAKTTLPEFPKEALEFHKSLK